ncbi:MAG TPA: ABC transporter substrate-binding protein [Streptosporangiaceae bacterium]|nr:ABC transporter substrate-binding protein [Streptosporangiaceae bacterium]
MNRSVHWRTRTAVAAVAALSLGVLAACSSSASSSSSSAAGGTSSSAPSSASSGSAGTVSTSSCGSKPGVAATGTPINIGAINTKQPGTDFSDIENMTGAYFACVNANGGINGHPIKFFPVTEQTNPSQIASLAKQLVTSDHVVGMMGSSSIIECSVNAAYWKSVGIYVLAAGIAPECYSTPNTASVNMGPRYSSDGAVQYVLAQGANKIAFDQANVPGTDYVAAGPNALAKAKGVPIQDFTENVPITSANAIATKLVTAAGPGGAVVLNFTPPEALLILQAAQKLNLEDRVKYWACSTPCNTDFLATSLGPKWNNKLFVNSELLPLDGNTSQTAQLFQAVLKQYGTNVSGGVGSFSEMGFTMGEIATKALESVKGDYTIASVSAALKGVTNFNTGMLCQGFTYGNYPTHLPNNMDYTVTPNNGKMVIASTGGGCTLISADDPQVAAYRAVAGTAPAVG